MSDLVSGMPLGRYRVGERLATGGMGEVRLAVQTGLGRYEKPIALKFLLAHLATEPSAVSMFLEEARLASRMSHPNIVQIFDVGVEQDRYYIAMELVRGVSMATLIRALKESGKSLSQPILEYVGRALCDGLHHAHEQTDSAGRALSIVHRDVTPHNVLISQTGEVKLTDFGIAKARDPDLHTRPGALKGKMAYLAPEQVVGKEVDRRADIFGAGVSLFELASHLSPFARDSLRGTLEAIRCTPLPSLASLRPDLSASFVVAVERATRKAPGDRFANALAFRNAIAPSFSSETADELGAVVRELCTEQLRRMEEKTAHTLLLQATTAEATGAEPGTEHATLPAPARQRWRVGTWVVAGASGLVLWFASEGKLAEDPAPPVRAATAPEAPPTAQVAPAAVVAPSEAPAPKPPEEGGEETRSQPPRPTFREVGARASRAGASQRKGKTGLLFVDATPWAQVFMNGEPIGETPMARFPVVEGWVVVTLKNPENGKSSTRKLKVVAGQEIRVKADLR